MDEQMGLPIRIRDEVIFVECQYMGRGRYRLRARVWVAGSKALCLTETFEDLSLDEAQQVVANIYDHTFDEGAIES